VNRERLDEAWVGQTPNISFVKGGVAQKESQDVIRFLQNYFLRYEHFNLLTRKTARSGYGLQVLIRRAAKRRNASLIDFSGFGNNEDNLLGCSSRK
jgi:hypothetical protein